MRLTLLIASILIVQSAFCQNEMYDICPIKVSEKIPNSLIYTENGEQLNLKDYIGNQKSILIFYRGGWCPYCTRHISDLNEIKEQIDDLGYKLYAIGMDAPLKLDSTYKKSSKTEFTLLSDSKANAIKDFGIAWKASDELFEKYRDSYGVDLEWWSENMHHMLPVPAVFVVEKGVVKYSHVNPNYSQRLAPNVLLKMLE